jgi:hypothetical protein
MRRAIAELTPLMNTPHSLIEYAQQKSVLGQECENIPRANGSEHPVAVGQLAVRCRGDLFRCPSAHAINGHFLADNADQLSMLAVFGRLFG